MCSWTLQVNPPAVLLTWDRSTCRGWPGIRWRRRTGSWRWCTRRRARRERGGSGEDGRYTAWRAGKRWSADPPGWGATGCLYPAGTQNLLSDWGAFDAPHRMWSLSFKHAKHVHMLLQQLTAVMEAAFLWRSAAISQLYSGLITLHDVQWIPVLSGGSF